MKIRVICFLNLATYAPENDEYPFSPGLTVGELLESLGITGEEVRTVFVNGLHASMEQSLAENDRMFIVPALAGG